MKKKIILLFTLFLTFVLLINTADARRFGGGRSLGKSWSGVSHRNHSSYAYPQNKRTNQVANKKGALKGALMGLVAGGLIGWLISGGAFHGFQGLDFILIAALCFLLFKFFKSRKVMASNKNAYANAYFNQAAYNEGVMFGHNHEAHTNHSSRPSWFNEEKFINGAKRHFINLQAAWDNHDLALIQTYCSPELFENITKERSLYKGLQQTRILNLNARLLDVIDEGDYITAGIEFIAEVISNNQSPEKITEIWSIQHNKLDANGNWVIIGIEQK